MANPVVRFEKFILKIFTQMLQRSYSVASQTVPIKSSFATKLIPYPWVISDFFTNDTRDRDLKWSFLTLLPHLRFAAYLAMRLLFLVLILSSADFFLQVVNFYSSETTLDNVSTVDVMWGNDLSYDGCKKVQERPCSTFPAKG